MVRRRAEWIGDIDLNRLKSQKRDSERPRQEGDGKVHSTYRPPGDSPRSRDSYGSFRVDDLLSRIINKVEGSDEML
uniref:Uncharacterized protein n=1 Tax=Solanum tuberosum TaxID=4113 RepID=M1DRH5_SOLTU